MQSMPKQKLSEAVANISKPIKEKPLRWICEKASSFNADSRYQTVESLKADVQRYLDKFPVRAKENSIFSSIFNWTNDQGNVLGGTAASQQAMAEHVEQEQRQTLRVASQAAAFQQEILTENCWVAPLLCKFCGVLIFFALISFTKLVLVSKDNVDFV